MDREFKDGDPGVMILPPSNERKAGKQPNQTATQAPVNPLIGFTFMVALILGIFWFFTRVVLPALGHLVLVLCAGLQLGKMLGVTWFNTTPAPPPQVKAVYYAFVGIVFFSYATDASYQVFPANWVGFIACVIVVIKILSTVKKTNSPILGRLVEWTTRIAGASYLLAIYLVKFGIIR